jgi:hypothetical protein
MNSKPLYKKEYTTPKPDKTEENLEKNRYFEPTETIAWIIGISNYAVVRKCGH